MLGEEGDVLAEEARKLTASLEPPKQFVPWVVIDGQPLFDWYDGVHTFACAILDPEHRPGVCAIPSYELTPGGATNRGVDGVCFQDT